MHNGWRNFQTWAAFFWLTSDRRDFLAALEAAQKGTEALRAFVEDQMLEIERPEQSLSRLLVSKAAEEIDYGTLHNFFTSLSELSISCWLQRLPQAIIMKGD